MTRRPGTQVRQRPSDVARATQPSRPANTIKLRAWYECVGDQLCVPGTVQLVFATSNSRPKYRTKHEITLVVDKETEITDLQTEYVEQAAPAGSDRVEEIIVGSIPTADFLSLAGGGRVNYKIGSTKGKLNDDQLAAVAALAEKIEEAKKIEAEKG